MAMERQDYPAMLPQLQPPQAVHILNDRVQQVGRLNVAIADWLQERRRLEEQYAAGLRKLSQRQLQGVELGVFSGPWTTLTGSADSLADSHSALATKIEVDVERPLREFISNNREMSAMSTVQGNLAAMAKDVESAQQKTDKLRGRGDKAEAGKVANANSDLDTAQTHWESQAPYVFENLQALDETRLNHLRDVLTQYQTHEVDQVERNRITAEQCLNVLLNVETADEIKTFAMRAVQDKPPLSRAARSSVAYATPQRVGQPSSLSSSTPAISQPEEELTRERSGSLQDDKQKGRMKGLRRLGTVMSRRRESKMPSSLPSTAESPERKQRPSPFTSISGRFRSRDNTPTLEALQDTSPRERPRSPPRLGSEIFQSSSEMQAEPTTPTPANQTLEAPHINGTSTASPAASTPLAIPNDSHQADLTDLEPPKQAEHARQESLAALEGQKDAEGFSVPPQELDPISQAQQEAALANESNSSQLNVNIRDAPIQEEPGSADAALASVANKLEAPPPTITRRGGTIRGRRQDRNSTVNSAFAPPEQSIAESTPESTSPAPKEISEQQSMQTTSPSLQPTVNTGMTESVPEAFTPGQVAASTFSPFSPQSDQQSSLRPESRATTSIDQTRTDTHSIRSATTTGSQGGSKHPELTETGLNSSIVETVSARFENGKLMTSALLGEIALAYNPTDFSSPFGSENIRLENFASLEKVAPNPAFINQTPDKEGEFSVNLSSLTKTQVAFKYQVHLDDGGSQAPLLVTPAFKIEPNQCSIIISYSLNPTFSLQGRESITLSNVMLALTVEGTKATSCLSRPVGTFSRDKNLIFWQLNDVTLAPGAAPTKLLARFAIESEAKGGSVEARWDIPSENAQDLGSGIGVSIQSQDAATGSDPFSDESAPASKWKGIRGVKKLTSGSYLAK